MTFRAPWGREVMVVTLLGLIAIGVPPLIQLSRGYWVVSVLLLALLAVIISLCVRGYELAPGELRIRRLFWDTRWPLDAATRAFVRPNAMRGSWRTWGNGGMFAIAGHFAGSGLGRYRAFVTDPNRTVIVESGRGIVVVSPDDPERFADAIAMETRRLRDSGPAGRVSPGGCRAIDTGIKRRP